MKTKKIDKSYLYFLHADATGVVDLNTHGKEEKILIHTTTEDQQKSQHKKM